MLKRRQGEGTLFYCCTGLPWPQDVIPATMPALQHRHEAPPRCGDMCRGPSSGPSSRWFHPSFAGIFPFPAQLGPHIGFCVVFSRVIILNGVFLKGKKTLSERSCNFWLKKEKSNVCAEEPISKIFFSKNNSKLSQTLRLELGSKCKLPFLSFNFIMQSIKLLHNIFPIYV